MIVARHRKQYNNVYKTHKSVPNTILKTENNRINMVHHYLHRTTITYAEKNYLFTLQFKISAYIVYERRNMIKKILIIQQRNNISILYFYLFYKLHYNSAIHEA